MKKQEVSTVFLNSPRIKRPKPLFKQLCSRESFKGGDAG